MIESSSVDPKKIIKEIKENGFAVLRKHLGHTVLEACRDAFWPGLVKYIVEHKDSPNRGPHRHFVPMPFSPPCFSPTFFFDKTLLTILQSVMDEKIVADQWACDAPVMGSIYQEAHVDYQRPLFPELPDLDLPIYMLVVSFGLTNITRENGPIEIAPATHRQERKRAKELVESGKIKMEPIFLDVGDVLVRHPWVLHRGTPNQTETPRALLTIRWVRDWYADSSRDVNMIPQSVWFSLTPEQQNLMRFPIQEPIPSTDKVV
jgi:ectoine hydroxylase-related dioxygenase (phytanoyl-CoA dioxygenase family)